MIHTVVLLVSSTFRSYVFYTFVLFRDKTYCDPGPNEKHNNKSECKQKQASATGKLQVLTV